MGGWVGGQAVGFGECVGVASKEKQGYVSTDKRLAALAPGCGAQLPEHLPCKASACWTCKASDLLDLERLGLPYAMDSYAAQERITGKKRSTSAADDYDRFRAEAPYGPIAKVLRFGEEALTYICPFALLWTPGSNPRGSMSAW